MCFLSAPQHATGCCADDASASLTLEPRALQHDHHQVSERDAVVVQMPRQHIQSLDDELRLIVQI